MDIAAIIDKDFISTVVGGAVVGLCIGLYKFANWLWKKWKGDRTRQSISVEIDEKIDRSNLDRDRIIAEQAAILHRLSEQLDLALSENGRIPGLEKHIEGLKELVNKQQQEIDQLRKDSAATKQKDEKEIAGLRQEVSVLKAENTQLKEEVAILKAESRENKQQLNGLEKRSGTGTLGGQQ